MSNLKKTRGVTSFSPGSDTPLSGGTLYKDCSTNILEKQVSPLEQASSPPLPSLAPVRVQPESVQVPDLTGGIAREGLVSTGAIEDLPERAIITLTIEIEAPTCGAVDLEKLLSRPGRSIWLRHYLGEAIRYVVGKDRGRQWSYSVKSGRITWRGLQ